MPRAGYIIGLDEVGRGALAGPVTVGAVILKRGARPEAISGGLPLRDSKKLSASQRERWVKSLEKSCFAPYAVASASSKEVDRLNVSRAANLAAGRAVRKLAERHKIDLRKAKIFLDGGLFLKEGSVKFASVRTIVKGDEKIKAIALASIVAKVHRDRLMTKKHSRYPVYGFKRHKGYGTSAHIRLVKRYGLSPLHRKTFCRFV